MTGHIIIGVAAMTIAFDIYTAPVITNLPSSGINTMSFAAIGQPSGFQWRLVGTNLAYPNQSQITGVISSIQLVSDTGVVLQTISVDPAQMAGLAGALSAFADVADDYTFLARRSPDQAQPDTMGTPVASGGGTLLIVPVTFAGDSNFWRWRFEGSGFVDGSLQ